MKTISKNNVSKLVKSYNGIGLSKVGFASTVTEVWNDSLAIGDEKSLVIAITEPLFRSIKDGKTYQQARKGEISFDEFFHAFENLVDVKTYKSGTSVAYKTVYGEKLNSGRLTTPDERAAIREARLAAQLAAQGATPNGTAPTKPVVSVASIVKVVKTSKMKKSDIVKLISALAAL
jgi:hypothetical protein